MTNENTHNPFAATEDEESFDVDVDLGAGSIKLEGPHILELLVVSKGESKAGNPKFTWEFAIVSTLDGVVIEGAPERSLHTALTDRAMWKVEQTLTALGLGTVINGVLKAKFKPSDAVGRQCVADLSVGEFNNRPTIEIGDLIPHPKGAGYRATKGAAPF